MSIGLIFELVSASDGQRFFYGSIRRSKCLNEPIIEEHQFDTEIDIEELRERITEIPAFNI